MINKNFKKIILLAFFLLFFIVLAVNAQDYQRELEIKYPEIFGYAPETVETTFLPKYVRYMFYFLVLSIGTLWFVFRGFEFITSYGNPEKFKKAKEDFLYVLLGFIILFCSWLILNTINPQLIDLRFPTIEKLPFSYQEAEIPFSPPVYQNWLQRITEIADSVKILSKDKIESTAEDIFLLTSICDCMHSQPLCLTKKDNPESDEIILDYAEGQCQAIYCYSANESQPCPGGLEIKKRQQILIDSLYEILYYKKRAAVERDNFLIEIENLEKEIEHQDLEIKAEENFLNKIETAQGKAQQQEVINNLEKEKEELINKYNNYKKLEQELGNLTVLIEAITTPVENLYILPDQCLSNIKGKCQGFCQGGGHDTSGCFPDKCQGKIQGEDNPCPMEDIEKELEDIGFSAKIINATADNVIGLIKTIIQL